MSVGIECPVCEAVFLVKEVSSTTGIRCPECKRKFRYSEDVLAKVPEQPAKKTKPDQATATAEKRPNEKRARFKTKPATNEHPPLPTTQPDQKSSAATDDHSLNASASESPEKIDVGQDSPPNLSLIQARKKHKARRQATNAIAAIAVLSIVIAILGTVLYRQVYLPPTPDKLANESTADLEPIDGSLLDPMLSDPQWKESMGDPSDQADQSEPEDDDEDQVIELPRVLANDLPKREFEYLQRTELRLLWQRIRPRLISLDVRTDLGVKPSVGIIVDSRGWVLTSNQLVSKWPDVSATASARDIDTYYMNLDAHKQAADDGPAKQALLTDVSKGIVIAKPKQDQALLALNTRFVVSLDKFEYASRNNIVSGMYLAQVAPPSPTNPYGYEEIKVLGRQAFEELETEARNKAKVLGIDDPLVTWIVTTKKAAPLLGTPLLTRTGKLAGTFVFSTTQYAYFMMTDQTQNMIAQAAGAETGPLKQVSPTTELLSEGHSMARPSELLNRAGVACEAFGWISTNKDQYQQLQKFSRRFSTVAGFIKDQQDDVSDSISLSILSDQIKRWQRSLSQSIRDAGKTSPEKIAQLNTIAVDKLAARNPNTANTYIPFIAEVYSAGIDDDGQDSILMVIGENQAIIKVPYSRESGRMRPGSMWLCFYKRGSRLSRRQLQMGSGEPVPMFYNGTILTVLGPIPKR